MEVETNVYAFCAVRVHDKRVHACRVSMRVIGGRADAGTDCRESHTTCSISGFCCLGEPPCIYTPAWLPEQPELLIRELLV